MNRRALIQAMGLTWIGLNFGLLAGCSDPHSAEAQRAFSPLDDEAGAKLAALAQSLVGIEYIGPVCANRTNSRQPLRDLLTQMRRQQADTLADAFFEQVSADFSAGRTVEIDGWQISAAECLLVAGAARLRGLAEPLETEAADYQVQDFAQIGPWGPSETFEGQIFNPIGNGRGGFWVQIEGSVPSTSRLLLAGQELATHFSPGLVTASLEPGYMDRVISTPGLYELQIADTAGRLIQSIGFLTVHPAPLKAKLDNGTESAVFCQIEAWGPDHATEGSAFNQQPDGDASFWVRMGCAPDTAHLMLNDTRLPTNIRPGLVAGRVRHYQELERGIYRLWIEDPASGESLTIGEFNVL